MYYCNSFESGPQKGSLTTNSELLLNVCGFFLAQLKQENDELRAELAALKEQPAAIAQQEAALEQKPKCADEIGIERNILRQEIHALQVQQIHLFILPTCN